MPRVNPEPPESPRHSLPTSAKDVKLSQEALEQINKVAEEQIAKHGKKLESQKSGKDLSAAKKEFARRTYTRLLEEAREKEFQKMQAPKSKKAWGATESQRAAPSQEPARKKPQGLLRRFLNIFRRSVKVHPKSGKMLRQVVVVGPSRSQRGSSPKRRGSSK